MQLYGDSAHELDSAWLASAISKRSLRSNELSALRCVLIACGQLEQLLEDGARSAVLCRAARAATDHAAAAFYSAWANYNGSAPRPAWSANEEREQMRARLAEIAKAGDLRGKLKIPEGFAFYALYPEQYCAAAVAYLRRAQSPLRALHVIGLRSIGTTLSAAVAAVLRAARVEPRRYTVRPHGHPFARELDLDLPNDIPDAALVVDEGPGLSGSSFFAVARALERMGVPPAAQVYFCAHSHPPGRMASAPILEFWQRAERYAGADYDSAIGPQGGLLPSLRSQLSRHYGSPIVDFESVSGGAWRAHAYRDPALWPAAYPPFERPKWLARLHDGRRVLLKYYGQVFRPEPTQCGLQSADEAAAQQIGRSDRDPFLAHGYLGRLWREGRLLSRSDKNPCLLFELVEFLAQRPWRRRGAGSAADAHFGCSGQLAPQEWVSQATTRSSKLPETLQGYDHTAIDAEPLGWDLAGAAIEWELDADELAWLLERFAARSKIRVSRAELAPHLVKYAQFRATLADFCAEQTAGADAQRLRNEAQRYAAHAARASS